MVAANELVGRSFADATLTAIMWRENGVALNVELGHADEGLVGSTSVTFVCRWLTSMDLALDLKRNPGPPLTWDGRVTRQSSGALRLEFDFASAGSITIECAELEVRSRA